MLKGQNFCFLNNKKLISRKNLSDRKNESSTLWNTCQNFSFVKVGNTESTHHSLQPKVVRQNTVNNALYPHGPAFGKTSQDDSFGFTKSHKLSNLYARAVQAFIQPIIFVMMTLEGKKSKK